MAGSKPAVLPITPPGSVGRRNPSEHSACQSRQLCECFGHISETLGNRRANLRFMRGQFEKILIEPLPPLISQDKGRVVC